MGSVTAEKLTNAATGQTDSYLDTDDFTALNVTATKKTIEANIYAARHVMRDLGGIDPVETGRVLGNAVAKKFDLDCLTAIAGTSTTPIDS